MKSKNLGLISALVSSICCVGPALLAFVGLFGFAGGVFSWYHWYFIAAGVIGVAVAWWQYRREKKQLHALGSRMRNEGTTRAVLAFSTGIIAVVLGFAVYPLLARQASSPTAPVAATTATVSLKSISIPVSGMDCEMCAYPIKARLHQLPGVGKVDVDVPNGKVSVNYDPSRVKPQQLLAAIDSTGYKASLPKP
jgi:mercuric ion transport protein